MNHSMPVLPVHHQLPEFTQTQPIESVMPSSHLILWHPLLLLPPFPPSFRVFSSESTLHTWWPKYWSFSFSISPLKEIPGLLSFRMDWLGLLAPLLHRQEIAEMKFTSHWSGLIILTIIGYHLPNEEIFYPSN